jgi:hypothetical protein
MQMPSSWQFFLATSYNMERVMEITNQCRSKNFKLGVNKPGSFSFNIDLSSTTALATNPYIACVIAQKDGDVVWSGPIRTRSRNLTTRKIALECAGWFHLLNFRYWLDADKTYTSQEDGNIAIDLLNYANEYEVDGIARTTHISEGANETVAQRTLTVPFGKNIGEQITDLSNIEDGFDFEVDPETKELNLLNSQSFEDRPEIVWGYNWGPDNLRDLSIDENGDEMKNQEFVSSELGTAEAHDSDSIAAYGLHQDVISLSDTAKMGVQAAIANEEVAVSKNPRILYTLAPKIENLTNVPEFFTDYNLRDKVYLSADVDGATLEGVGIRVFGIDFNLDDNDNQIVNSIDTTFSG